MRAAVALLPAPLLLLAACASGPRPAAPAEARLPAAGFVTRLGNDTLAVERLVRRPDGYDASVVVRVPQTVQTDYRLRLSPEGALVSYEAVSRVPGRSEVVRRETAQPVGDSLRVTVATPAATRTRTFAAGPDVLPFAEYTHWPFEAVLQRARRIDAVRTEHPLFTERGVVRFAVETGEGDAVSVIHPTRGVMQAEADEAGTLQRLDASATTRKLVVERTEAPDMDALAQRFAARDATGQGVGAVSGRVRTEYRVGEATVHLDYGQPSARGRALFGALVPWGVRWRTGADQATHLETDRDLFVGALRVPAGRYTLSSIPAPDGGVLIVNRQTGQTGTAYDAAQDLGRVPLRRVTGQPYGDRLALRVTDGGADGQQLRIEWGDEALVVALRLAD